MTDAELILADLILMKLPVGRQLSIVGFMGPHLFEGKQGQLSQTTLEEINKIIASRSDVIRTFLLKEKYITIVNHMVPWDIITEKGEKAQELGGHIQYKEWLQKENDKKNKEQKKITWSQKNWLPLLIFTAIVAPLLVVWLQAVIQKHTDQVQPTIQVVHDTFYIRGIDKNQEILQKTSLPKRDTVKN